MKTHHHPLRALLIPALCGIVFLLSTPDSAVAQWDFGDDGDFKVRLESFIRKEVPSVPLPGPEDEPTLGYIGTWKTGPDKVKYQTVLRQGYSEISSTVLAKHKNGSLQLGNLKPADVALHPDADGGPSIIFTLKLNESQMADYDRTHTVKLPPSAETDSGQSSTSQPSAKQIATATQPSANPETTQLPWHKRVLAFFKRGKSH